MGRNTDALRRVCFLESVAPQPIVHDMRPPRSCTLLAALAMALAAVSISAAPAPAAPEADAQRVEVPGALDAEWGPYRRAYGASAFFERFTRTRPLIQAQMQVRPTAPDA